MRDVRLPEFPFVLPIDVRFRDLDAMGHVNNAVYLTYLEQARTEYWFALQGIRGTAQPPIEGLADGLGEFRKLGFVVVHLECDFASPAFLGEELLVGCRISEVRRTSFIFDYRIVSRQSTSDAESRLVASGKTVQVLYDWNAGAGVPFPDDLLKRVEAMEGAGLKCRPR